MDARARPEPGHVAALVARFPEFAPLRVALANAQLAAGDADAAAETIAAIKDLKLVYGAGKTLAAIQLAKGNPAGALRTLANKRLWYSYPEEADAGHEADGRMGRLFRQQAEIAYQAQLALHHLKSDGEHYEKDFDDKKGIIFFADYWQRKNETGQTRTGDHIDLWDDKTLASLGTFESFVRVNIGLSIDGWFSDFGKAKQVLFWEIK